MATAPQPPSRPAAQPVSYTVRVRHEVADVAVLRAEDRPTTPAVLPAVSYWDVRPWQRRSAKLPRQRSLTVANP
jgi:hypothetical protein